MSNKVIVFSNTIRGVSSSLINAFVCFGFTALHLPSDLKDFIIFFTGVNLLLSFVNWGLKDYSVKLFVSESGTEKVFSQLFSIRLTLFILIGVFICFIPIELTLILFVLVFSFLKSINNTIEAFSTAISKNSLFAVVDLFFLISLVTYYGLNSGFQLTIVILLMIITELSKLFVGIILFRKVISFKIINPIPFLKTTFNYFLIAFFAFLLSKTDFYIASLYLPSNEIINYHIYSSLIGLSQIIIASFFSRQMVDLFSSGEKTFSDLYKGLLIKALALSILALPFFYFITQYFYKFEISVALIALVFCNLFIYSIVIFEMYLKTHQNRSQMLLVGVLVSAAINIICSFSIINYLGMMGAVFSNIAGLLSLYVFFKVKK
jgi:hypothetical protein